MNSTAEGASRRRLAGTIAAFLILVLRSADLRAEVKLLHVDPQQTDPAIEAVHGPHIALYDPQVPPAHRLFVFFVGTGSKAEASLTIDSAFVKWGYHAIGLDYENNILAVSCAHSLDSACFDHYRDAIVTGDSLSEKIKVDRANSILNRFQRLLLYLVKEDPDGGWSEFVANGQPMWSRIVVAGHSQGSGHAAYLGKKFIVDKVLMFSGPQDFLNNLDKPAPWQARPSATPPSRFFAFLNSNDPFNVHHQIANCMVLMGFSKPETQTVEPGQVIDGNYRILVNNVEAKRAHGSTLLPQFENVWRYLSATGEEDKELGP